jgi:Zn-dependent metalloprotease
MLDPDGVARLVRLTAGRGRVSVRPATGAVRFVGFPHDTSARLAPKFVESVEKRAVRFLTDQRSVFGIRDTAAELELQKSEGDLQGWRHLSYRQMYRGVPVFGAILRVHFDPDGSLAVVNGTFVPGISRSTRRRR